VLAGYASVADCKTIGNIFGFEVGAVSSLEHKAQQKREQRYQRNQNDMFAFHENSLAESRQNYSGDRELETIL
jgi:hypothetical protein